MWVPNGGTDLDLLLGGLRIALGAFRTSPVQSLYAEAGEPSLKHRRLKLSLNYNLKSRSLSENPCHDLISSLPPSELFRL